MLSFTGGKPIARIISGKNTGKIIYLDSEETEKGPKYAKIDLKGNKLEPLMTYRVSFVAGPSGSGKSTYAAKLLTSFRKLHPKKDIYFFSRTSVDTDPAYKKIKPIQVTVDQSLVDDPIMIEDIDKGSCLVFDDVNTIHDKNIKNEVLHIVKDVLEVGRRMELSIIITSHLINPPEKEYARTVLNELQTITIFPRGSSAYQIRYVLKEYFGMDSKQIEQILKIPSRWVTVTRGYPTCVLYDSGAYVL